ncbi:MAG TPA: SpoIIE family protein phosphatase, partial [Thermoanaerobaculia bacterium]|nr:SpoIIE family protein phosphatase [Thermoanaerobaculia bacterium]
ASAALALVAYAGGQVAATVAGLVNLCLLGALLTRSSSEGLVRRSRVVAVAVLLLEGALLLWLLWDQPATLKIALALGYSGLLFWFRFTAAEAALVLVPLWATTCFIWTLELKDLWLAPKNLGGVIWPTAVLGSVLAGIATSTRHRRQRFLQTWRRESSLDRERERLREEVESARQIQISMLPRATPRLDWLDIAGVSMPAHEVGGDYYDYFTLAEDEFAVVIGDVAGHGLASGLLLSGLRSCLYLLRTELNQPVAVLEKLDDMVRNTTGKRLLVTLQCACFSAKEREVRIASAGHPPVLRYSAREGKIREVSLPALPLGTRLGASFREEQLALEAGDVLLFYTDGLVETANLAGEPYGPTRLASVFSQAARARSSLEIRNSLLADLANFKGDSRRNDDVTLVVSQVR